MGYGFPAAIGAQVGKPDHLVIDIAGDGSFQMNLQQLGVVAAYNIPVKIVIINNQYLGMVRQWQELFYQRRYSHTDLSSGMPDFVKLAEAYDIAAFRVGDPADLKEILKKAFFEIKGPVIVDVRIVREENVFPMVPAGGTLDKMLFE
jgi:acetolactate synthase-1/2/3 large subunit